MSEWRTDFENAKNGEQVLLAVTIGHPTILGVVIAEWSDKAKFGGLHGPDRPGWQEYVEGDEYNCIAHEPKDAFYWMPLPIPPPRPSPSASLSKEQGQFRGGESSPEV